MKSFMITLAMMSFGLSAFAATNVIDPLKVAKVDVHVSAEIDGGYTCGIWRWESGPRLELENEREGKCPKKPSKEEIKKLSREERKWLNNHAYLENHIRYKMATPVITMKDGSEVELETIKFERYKETAEDEDWGRLPWGYDAPLAGWLEQARTIVAGGAQVYYTDHCFRNGLSKKILRDERAGGTLYNAGSEQVFEHCEGIPATDIQVIKN